MLLANPDDHAPPWDKSTLHLLLLAAGMLRTETGGEGGRGDARGPSGDFKNAILMVYRSR